jgi:hypothetical protein
VTTVICNETPTYATHGSQAHGSQAGIQFADLLSPWINYESTAAGEGRGHRHLYTKFVLSSFHMD